MARTLCIGLLLLSWLGSWANAAVYKLTDGSTLEGEPISFNENGMVVRLPDGKYSERVPWGKFSQDALKLLMEDTKAAEFVEPFIELTPEERERKTGIVLQDVPRLERPADQSVIGSLFASGIGLFAIALIYLANLYAAYEVSVYRAQPPALVCGVAAVLPILGPIIFLSMPTRMPKQEEEVLPQDEVEAQTYTVGEQPAAAEAHGQGAAPAAAHGHHPAASAASALPPTQTFARGQFTFNRRFIETRFPGFFGVARKESDKDMVLGIKAARGHYVATRITRIAASEMHVQVQKGQASEEVMIPFLEIQEIQLKHKDA